MKVLIAGFGSAGRRHFRNLAALGVSDVGFYRSSHSTLPTDEIAGCRVFGDLQEALAWGPTAAIIANPTALHVSTALAAARAGVDILVEKPLSHSLDGCDELISVCRDRALVTMVGFQYRFHPLLIRLRTGLLQGEFGRPLTARAEYGDSIRLWHPWEDYRRSYSARPELGGGAIVTLMHPLDYLYWLFGEVRNVHASMCKADFLETSVADDIAHVTLEFQSGVVAHVQMDFVQDPPAQTLDVWCVRGRVRLDFLAGTLDWRPYGAASGSVERVAEGFERNTMFVDEVRHFLECVQRRRPTAVPLPDGIAVLEVAIRARQDAERRKP